MSPRSLAHGHRELTAEYQDLGVLPPRLPPRQARTDTARVTTRKISFKPTSRRSSHASPSQDLPARHRSPGRADAVSQSICPGGAGFRHPQGHRGPRHPGRHGAAPAAVHADARPSSGAAPASRSRGLCVGQNEGSPMIFPRAPNTLTVRQITATTE
jgi:hypothetical protein